MINTGIVKSLLTCIPPGIMTLQQDSILLPYYHVVSDEDPKHIRHLYACRGVAAFLSDLDFLLKHYRPLSLEEVHAWLRHGTELRGKCFHLTFDDGFRECHDLIAPILKSKGVPATFFVCSDFIGNKRLFFRNKISLLYDMFSKGIVDGKEQQLAEMFAQHGIEYQGLRHSLLSIRYNTAFILDEIAAILEYDFDAYLKNHTPYLDRLQIENLVNDGFAIGSHSVDHPLYQELSLEQQIQQTKDSMAEIEKLFRVQTRAFAFPHNGNNVTRGFFNETRDAIDIYFGTNRMKKDPVPECLQRFSLEDNRFSCEEIIKGNILLQVFNRATFRGTVRREL